MILRFVFTFLYHYIVGIPRYQWFLVYDRFFVMLMKMSALIMLSLNKRKPNETFLRS